MGKERITIGSRGGIFMKRVALRPGAASKYLLIRGGRYHGIIADVNQDIVK